MLRVRQPKKLEKPCFFIGLEPKVLKNIVFLYVFDKIKLTQLVSMGGCGGQVMESSFAAMSGRWPHEKSNVSGIIAKPLYFIVFSMHQCRGGVFLDAREFS